jgi:hypothetical protein
VSNDFDAMKNFPPSCKLLRATKKSMKLSFEWLKMQERRECNNSKSEMSFNENFFYFFEPLSEDDSIFAYDKNTSKDRERKKNHHHDHH